MTTHNWVKRGPFVPTTSAEPATRPAAVWPAPASFQLFGAPRSLPPSVSIAGPSSSSSSSTVARKPSAKRDSVEKCREKEKIGKGSGVGSTAGQRAASSCKKAVKKRAASIELDGPAQAVLRLRAGRPRVNYKY
ncbi:hypothetical protein PENSPDRAFT_659837 [Peniophora sp. CONT]|nr:hypothetical protein PENSPDRAFT_659837 [Peniophora sp. CONT]